MKTLLVMRHAKSSWDNAFLGDHERPLNKRGKADAPRMGQLLRQEELVPDLIISSTAKRAEATAEATADAAGYEGAITYTGSFYHADPDAYIEELQTVDDLVERVMVVGHNPGMEELVSQLTDQSLRFTTANIACIKLPIKSWGELTEETMGELHAHWQPRSLR